MLVVDSAVSANRKLIEVERLCRRKGGGSGSQVRIGKIFVEKESLRRKPVIGNPVAREGGCGCRSRS